MSTIFFQPGTEDPDPRLTSVTVIELAINRHAAAVISSLREVLKELSGINFKCLKI